MQHRWSGALAPVPRGVVRSSTLASILLLSVGAQSPGFLLVSTPSASSVSWVKLPEGDKYDNSKTKVLIDTGLMHPQGIAIDQTRKRLYVADPGARKVFAYQLVFHNGELNTDGKQTTLARDTEARWVAVDGTGNVFFSDEASNSILKVPADRVLRGDFANDVIYSGHVLPQVNEPGGVAVDNFHVYWTNKHFGSEVGSVLKGSESPLLDGGPDPISILAKNSPKSYGLCLAMGNVYYTDSEKFLYGVKKSGGPITEISSQLKRPRGCVWDGDGTVYVADRGLNAVYAFAGNMHQLSKSKLKKAFDIPDAFGLAMVVSSDSRSLSALASRLGLLGLLMVILL